MTSTIPSPPHPHSQGATLYHRCLELAKGLHGMRGLPFLRSHIHHHHSKPNQFQTRYTAVSMNEARAQFPNPKIVFLTQQIL